MEQRTEVVAFLDDIPLYASEVPANELPMFVMTAGVAKKPNEGPVAPVPTDVPVPVKALTDKTMGALPAILTFGFNRKEVRSR